MQKDVVAGFGNIRHFNKFYFDQVGNEGLASLPYLMGNKTLYVAAARELKDNIEMHPEKIPEGLVLVKTINYPSGEPAFYFLTKDPNFHPVGLPKT